MTPTYSTCSLLNIHQNVHTNDYLSSMTSVQYPTFRTHIKDVFSLELSKR